MFTTNDNVIFDGIIAHRRSIRAFKADAVDKADIEALINAGLYAPYGGLANAGRDDFRRFVIFEQSGGRLAKLHAIIKNGAVTGVERMRAQAAAQPEKAAAMAPFIKRLETFAKNGLPGFEAAPCCIIVAERKGTPPAEKQSLAHVMQNIWLKATALNLGFWLVSALGIMGDNPAFCALVNLPVGEFAVEGCVVGYPACEPEARQLPQRLVAWL